jgi:hypothetical protein
LALHLGITSRAYPHGCHTYRATEFFSAALISIGIKSVSLENPAFKNNTTSSQNISNFTLTEKAIKFNFIAVYIGGEFRE